MYTLLSISILRLHSTTLEFINLILLLIFHLSSLCFLLHLLIWEFIKKRFYYASHKMKPLLISASSESICLCAWDYIEIAYSVSVVGITGQRLGIHFLFFILKYTLFYIIKYVHFQNSLFWKTYVLTFKY